MTSPLGDFLRSRRAQISPEQVGLPADAGRKVKGLRREEVASLASISFEYYLRLEQGRHRQPSSQVVESLAKALLLDEDGVYYLERLVRLQAGPAVIDHVRPELKSSIEALLGLWDTMTAYVCTPTGDVVLSNPRARTVGGPMFTEGSNLVISMFSASCRDSVCDWEAAAADVVANLRYRADPTDPHLQEIVGLLSMRDPDFRRLWARADARAMNSGSLRLSRGEWGRMRLVFQHFLIPDTPGWVLAVARTETDSAPVVSGPAQVSRGAA